MKKKELKVAVDNYCTETQTALQTMFDALNNGQQNKLLNDEKIKQLFDKYEVDY